MMPFKIGTATVPLLLGFKLEKRTAVIQWSVLDKVYTCNFFDACEQPL